jgi:RNA polymerase sigma factor (sigma-70 family)
VPGKLDTGFPRAHNYGLGLGNVGLDGGAVENTAVLLHRIAQGDTRARDQLASACLPLLRRFAHGRLPRYARGLVTTQDIVSVALTKAFGDIEKFDLRYEGAFLAYARTILLREIIDQIRRAKARPQGSELDERLASEGRSPIDEAMGQEFMSQYERALERLTPDQRQAAILRLEMGYSHERVAEAVGVPSADAARMLVSRALVRLAQELRPFAPNV